MERIFGVKRVAAHWSEGTEREFSSKLRRNASVVALRGTAVSNPRDSFHHRLNPRCSPIVLPGYYVWAMLSF